MKWVNRGLNAAVAAIFVLLTCDVLLGVVTRYLLRNQLRWTEELATFLLVWLTFLAAALAYRDDAHLGVDVLTSRFETEVQKWSKVGVHVIVLVLALVLFVGGGGMLFADRWESGQSMATLGIRRAWSYLAVPVCGLLLSLYATQKLVLKNP